MNRGQGIVKKGIGQETDNHTGKIQPDHAAQSEVNSPKHQQQR